MEDIREDRVEREDTNTSGESTNIILVVISVCVLIITVTVAAIFFFHPASGSDKDDYAYVGDPGSRQSVVTDETKARLENKEPETPADPTGPAVTGSNLPPSQANSLADNRVADSSTEDIRQGTNAVTYTYGDPEAQQVTAKNLSALPEVIIEKRYDPKTDQSTSRRQNSGTVTQGTETQPVIRNKATVVTSKQQTTSKKQPVVEKNTALTTVKQPRTISVKEYWVQVASFKSRTRAENLNTKLKQLGYAGTINTTSIAGETLFRVRLGPYSSNGEAEKFKGWLTNIDGLQDSYVSQSIKRKTIN